MTEHTPTPWEACRGWVCEENDPGHNVGICICETRDTEAETYANAAFIANAANSHDALVNACRRALVDLHAAQLLAQHTLGEPYGINQTISIVKAALDGVTGDPVGSRSKP